ncbi:MAG TPA: hypothetical protein VM901_01590 [Bdellovibrionota bacterium]|nr:hypothetical protein [Bdellovibrionota bacterium]
MGIGLSVVAPAHAFLNNIFGGDDSVTTSYYYSDVSVDNSTHIYLDTRPLEAKIEKLSEATNLTLLDKTERDRLTKEYKLDQLGKAIGLDIGKSGAAKMARVYGVDGLQEIIEDRLFYLRTNQVLTEAFGKAILAQPIEGDIARRRNVPGPLNEVEMVPVLDAARRRKDLGPFELYQELSRPNANRYMNRPRKYLNNENLSAKDQQAVLAALVYLSKGALDGAQSAVDFSGMNFMNLDENLDGLAANAGAFHAGIQRGFQDSELATKLELCQRLNDPKLSAELSERSDALKLFTAARYSKQPEVPTLAQFTAFGPSSLQSANALLEYTKHTLAATTRDVAGHAQLVEKTYKIDDDLRAQKIKEKELSDVRQGQIDQYQAQIQAIQDEWHISDADEEKIEDLRIKIRRLYNYESVAIDNLRTDQFNNERSITEAESALQTYRQAVGELQKEYTKIKNSGYCEYLATVKEGQAILQAQAAKSVPVQVNSGAAVEKETH